ncbi:OLC1v1039213C1 [Oldenlandia corymbosa var. corymbosa]|uniref:OLC1v1039213C1 n=1 Tax=Oldenlandia corymbosa var. corymbosa TaxID=529605 RepID=A0AAV1D471_OLDCO|nr:OLC1v1039213C1 [Oldenlandia corymbosa var. corymbosa]
MSTIFGILFFVPHFLAFQFPDPYPNFSKLYLGDSGANGPDSISRDPNNQGPYVGVSDGRIIKYNGTDFVDFAYLTPNRTKQLCDGVTDLSLGPVCGRPLGFTFDRYTGELYVVDAYGGFYKVGPQGGQATLLATSANGERFNFLNGVDYDKFRRVVYITEASEIYNFTSAILGLPGDPGDKSGKLLEYNTVTNTVRVLLNNLSAPAGPAVSEDGTYLLFSSYGTQQVFKYYLVGPKAGTAEFKINLPGFPVKIKRAAEFGFFWVAVNVVVQQQPRVVQPYGYKINGNGVVFLVKNFTAEYPNDIQVNVVQEYFDLPQGGVLYVGSRSRNVDYVVKYTKR